MRSHQQTDQLEQERLRRLDRYQISQTPPEAAFDDIVRLVADLFNAPIAFLCTTEAVCNWFKARVGIELEEVPRSISFCDHTLKGEGVMVVPDATLDERFSGSPMVTGPYHIRFYAGITLRDSDGFALGTLAVADVVPRRISEYQKNSLNRLASIALDRMELKKAQCELREAVAITETARQSAVSDHAELRQLIDCLPEAIVLMDAQNNFVLWNQNYEKMFPDMAKHFRPGINYETILRKALQNDRYYKPMDSSAKEIWIKNWVGQFNQSGAIVQQNYGDGRWIRYDQHPTPDGKKICVRTDITDDKNATDSFRLLFENNPVPMWVVEKSSHKYIDVNSAALEHYGYTREEFLRMTLVDIRPVREYQRILDDAKNNFGVDSGEGDWTHLKADGTEILVRTYAKPIKINNRDAAIVAIIDVTERRHAETALQTSEAMFRGLLAASPDVVIVVDQTGRILLTSQQVESVFGYTSEELAGQSIDALLPERYRNQHAVHINRFVKKPKGRNMGTGKELSALHKDGSEFPIEISLNQNRIDGNPVVIAAIRDITDRKAIEKQLRQSQKMEAIGNLTGGVAHDFNNLLGIIVGNLDLLRGLSGSGTTMDPRIDQLSSEALEAALRGADLTKRLLAYARRQPLRPQHIDVNELVGGISKLLNRTLGEDIEIKLNLGTAVWPVNADPSQLGASLINIGNNARDAMPKGGMLTIATSNQILDADFAMLHDGIVPGNYTLIAVSDTGTGIAPEMLSRIFEPFFTTKEQGKGTGLGLSMVFGFVMQSAGHVDVYSEVGHGTTFRLYLPRATSAADAPETVAVSEKGGHETILAVEDNEGLRRVVVRQLNDLGYRVLEAKDGNVAVKILESEPVDLLFTDIIMPGGMDGYTLARNAVSRWSGLKVLLTSGFPETKLDNADSIPNNMQLLTKPYRKDDLARTLRKVLDAR